MAKERLSITLDREIKEKLQQYAEEKHTTISAAVTAWVLSLKTDGMPGQVRLKL